MLYGLLSGILWGIDTVILGIALSKAPFLDGVEAVFLAPFVSTFFHDMLSAIWMTIYMIFKRQFKNTILACKTKSGKYIILGALLGGPVGLTGYLLSIKYLGPAYTAIISSLYPAIGALLSYIILKEKMKGYSIFGLVMSICGIIVLGYGEGNSGENVALGFAFALLCVFGWAAEAVICGYGMKAEEINPEQSLLIRQVTSTVFYGLIIIPIIKGIYFSLNIATNNVIYIIIGAALAGTASYVFYYKAIHKIGATKAMALNITYSAWAMIFGVLLLGNRISFKVVICCVLIMIGSILAAGDMEDIKSIILKNKIIRNSKE